ncbi:MAG: type III pantothenate kinase, partial [Candidatus Caldarchaeum sp.]
MLLLAVDVGNTNIGFGIFSGSELMTHFRVGTDRTKTSDEYGILIKNLIEARGISTRNIEGGIISCVVPPL